MYGYCMCALSVGTIISAVFTSSLKRKINTKKWFIITFIGYFLLSAIFSFQKNTYCIVIIFAVMGYIDAIMHNIISSCLQLNTDSDFRGVVFSLYSLMNNIMKPISVSIGGILGEFFSIRNVITITMILGIVVLIFCYRNKKLLNFFSLTYTENS